MCPYACTCVHTCAHVQTPFLTPRCPHERAPRDQGRALPAPQGSQPPAPCKRSARSRCPQAGANWGFGGRGFPSNPPDARLGVPAAGGSSQCLAPSAQSPPRASHRGTGARPHPPASATRPGLFWGACPGPGPHPLRTAWTWGTEPGARVGGPGAPARCQGEGAACPEAPGRAHPAGPDPHTTDNPMVLKSSSRPHPEGGGSS